MPELPPPSFQTLVATLASQAMHSLGMLAEEGKEPPPPNLEHAQFLIDLIGVIEIKTKGNLEKLEAEMLRGVLTDLRMAFVEAKEKG
jgi:hypothetical protein